MTGFQCPHCGSDAIRGDVEVSYTKVPIGPRGYAAQDGRIEEAELEAVYCGECGTRLEVISWGPPELAILKPRPPEPDWRHAVKAGCPHCGAGRNGAEYSIGIGVTDVDVGYKAWVNAERRAGIMHTEVDDEGILWGADREPGMREVTSVVCLDCMETIWEREEEAAGLAGVHPLRSCFCCACSTSFDLLLRPAKADPAIVETLEHHGPYCPMCGADGDQVLVEEGEVTLVPDPTPWEGALRDGCPHCHSRELVVWEETSVSRHVHIEDGEVTWGDLGTWGDGEASEVLCRRCGGSIWKRPGQVQASTLLGDLRSAFSTMVELRSFFSEMDTGRQDDRLESIIGWLERMLQALGEDTGALRERATSAQFSPFAHQD
jgi:hypothetical protein